MREQIARYIVLLTSLLLLALAASFAYVQNPATQTEERVSAPEAAVPAAGMPVPSDAERIAKGAELFVMHGCARCHDREREAFVESFAEGATADTITAWIVGDASLRDELPPYVLKQKQKYRALDADEIDAVIAYILSFR